MPTIEFRGREIECERGRILRDVLLEAGESPHNGRANWLNCRGHGTCGTCAVAIEGDASEPTAAERRRLAIPPHDPDAGLRLSCQTRVEGDLAVRKYEGFWGQRVPDSETSAASDDPTAPTDER
ncbi:(2Fe-2S)-binding protein [Haloterrigena sp. SYSU A558-1]|uniref:(2Fe-2S)-binding protein n=1 Tax=Haloterrigena gelatinilytica TaxID=2741724 RepID=A0A8J8GLL5_9EURY|nr:2Fe-2S iron-sulfur cluster-binding protein [Haloterrigena gelatinilytica]NUB92254.1 (2Fe-2S)-binding protein [Haloterrigena gelatinilytica]NUC71916.1 (2Fe-2S)-binding protein [Haloterrigena gelatinilytica]